METTKSINEIKNTDDETNKVVDDLQSNKFNNVIKYGKNSNHSRVSIFGNKKRMNSIFEKGKKRSGTIFIDNISDFKENTVILAHEMLHVFDFNNGILSTCKVLIGNSLLPLSEIDAINFENRVRAKLYKKSNPNSKRNTYPVGRLNLTIPDSYLNEYR